MASGLDPCRFQFLFHCHEELSEYCSCPMLIFFPFFKRGNQFWFFSGWSSVVKVKNTTASELARKEVGDIFTWEQHSAFHAVSCRDHHIIEQTNQRSLFVATLLSLSLCVHNNNWLFQKEPFCRNSSLSVYTTTIGFSKRKVVPLLFQSMTFAKKAVLWEDFKLEDKHNDDDDDNAATVMLLWYGKGSHN